MEDNYIAGKIVMLIDKIKNKIQNFFTRYDLKEREQQISTELKKVNLNFSEIVQGFENEIKKYEIPADGSMRSHHWEIFYGIGLTRKGDNIRNVLEIGTYNGHTTSLLAQIFKKATIYTIDLPDTDDDFINSYARSDGQQDFIKNRDTIIQSRRNIVQIKKNSFCLVAFDEPKFDLIWVDGAHGYPTVVSDIVNSYRLLSDGGILMVDDLVLETPTHPDKMYLSEGSFATLNELISLDAFENYCFPLKRTSIISGDKIINNKRIFVGTKKTVNTTNAL